jgi:hypothetical protein
MIKTDIHNIGDMLDEEKRLTLAQAARLLGVHVSQIHRYRLKGIHGVKLTCVSVGCKWHTARSWLEAFIEAVTAARNGDTLPVRTPSQRRQAKAAAEAEVFG